MALVRALPTPLYTEKSQSVESPVFFVTPGEIVLIQAFDFASAKVKVDEHDLGGAQLAKLQQILFKEEVDETVQDLRRFNAEVLAINDVLIDGCCITVCKENNVMLINVPGAYRFVLNDPTAVGTARLYFRTFTKDEFPWSKAMIGDLL